MKVSDWQAGVYCSCVYSVVGLRCTVFVYILLLDWHPGVYFSGANGVVVSQAGCTVVVYIVLLD